ncbi:hypothetical protein [Anaerosolibacter sp.]|uniref:hypothetical protein n=1 Tax=Anaerosolibacter sp. TaxID=1872527 RepID=UPI0039EEC42C
MKVIVHMENSEYVAQLFSEQIFYMLRNRISEYARDNNLSDAEQVEMYQHLIKHLEKGSNQ